MSSARSIIGVETLRCTSVGRFLLTGACTRLMITEHQYWIGQTASELDGWQTVHRHSHWG